MQLFVVTFTGADRPGIVDRLAAIVQAHGGNWEESRMAALAGRFAGILLVAVPPDQAEALVADLRAVDGLTVLVEEGEYTPIEEELLWSLSLTGNDQPGIVQQITRALLAAGSNIVDFESATEEAPMEGGVLFVCTAEIVLAESAVDGLANALEAIATDLLVDIELV